METQTQPKPRFNNSERKAIYEKVIKTIKKDLSKKHYVCNIIAYCAYSSKYILEENINKNNFPELFLFDIFDGMKIAWLTEGNYDDPIAQNKFKITVLELCIAMIDNPIEDEKPVVKLKKKHVDNKVICCNYCGVFYF